MEMSLSYNHSKFQLNVSKTDQVTNFEKWVSAVTK